MIIQLTFNKLHSFKRSIFVPYSPQQIFCDYIWGQCVCFPRIVSRWDALPQPGEFILIAKMLRQLTEIILQNFWWEQMINRKKLSKTIAFCMNTSSWARQSVPSCKLECVRQSFDLRLASCVLFCWIWCCVSPFLSFNGLATKARLCSFLTGSLIWCPWWNNHPSQRQTCRNGHWLGTTLHSIHPPPGDFSPCMGIPITSHSEAYTFP